MASLAVIRKGDKTSHGGEVITGDEFVTVFGKPMARKGDKVTCPKCGGTHSIVEGIMDASSDRQVVVEGMKTSCGATLIAGQQHYKVAAAGSSGGGGASAAQPKAFLAGGAAAAAATTQDAPKYCKAAHNTLDLTAAMFQRVRKPAKWVGPLPANIPSLVRMDHERRDAQGKRLDPMPDLLGRKTEVYIGPTRVDLYDLPRYVMKFKTYDDLYWQVPTLGQVINSLRVVPPKLITVSPIGHRMQSVEMRICDEMSDSDRERQRKSWRGVPYIGKPDPTSLSRVNGDAVMSYIRLYPMSTHRGVQAECDHVVLHEIAHHYADAKNVDIDKRWSAAIKSDGNSPSDYAKTSPDEDFAEFVVLAVVLQGTPCEAYARKIYKARYKYFDTMGILG